MEGGGERKKEKRRGRKEWLKEGRDAKDREIQRFLDRFIFRVSVRGDHILNEKNSRILCFALTGLAGGVTMPVRDTKGVWDSISDLLDFFTNHWSCARGYGKHLRGKVAAGPDSDS